MSVPKSVPDWGAQLLDNGKVKEAVYESKNLGFSVMVNDQKIQNSSDLLMSSGMETFLEEMRNTMDLIIIDAPYVRKRSDIEPWIHLGDMSLLVVKQNME